MLYVSLYLFFESCTKNEVVVDPDEADEDTLLQMVNDIRRHGCNCGTVYMPPTGSLDWNDQLEEAAQAHSDDMDLNRQLTHTGSDGASLRVRLDRVGYTWNYVGENVALNYGPEAKVIEGWLSSPGHCQNMMNDRYEVMAVARRGAYWTQIFGPQ